MGRAHELDELLAQIQPELDPGERALQPDINELVLMLPPRYAEQATRDTATYTPKKSRRMNGRAGNTLETGESRVRLTRIAHARQLRAFVACTVAAQRARRSPAPRRLAQGAYPVCPKHADAEGAWKAEYRFVQANEMRRVRVNVAMSGELRSFSVDRGT